MSQIVRDKTGTAKDEQDIRALAAAWSKALENRDLDGMMAGYAPDALLFDLKPPYRRDGADAIRRMWEACLPYFPEKFKAERRDLEVVASGDAAFLHGLHRIEPIGEPRPACETWIRVTVCYRRIGGAWRVTHEHVSVPFDPMTGKVATITEP